MTFAADTALEPVGDSRWRARYDGRWAVLRGPFGGFVAALLARALVQVTPWPPSALTIHFLDACEPGDLEITAEIVRRGRSTDGVALRADQGGRPMALALATAGSWRDNEPRWLDLARPDAPPASECPEIPAGDGRPPFFDELEVRWVAGTAPGSEPGGRAYNLAWVRTAPPEPLDHAVLAALGDVWLPPAFGKLGRVAVVPTLELSLHFRAPVPRAEEWVLIEHRSDHAAGGTWTCDGELWSRDGALLLQARQMAIIWA